MVTDTTSLRTSILQYTWENGRRYHADGDANTHYWSVPPGAGRRQLAELTGPSLRGPNDERQQTAEDLRYARTAASTPPPHHFSGANTAGSHQVHTLILGGLSEAPISEPQVGIEFISLADTRPANCASVSARPRRRLRHWSLGDVGYFRKPSRSPF